MQTPRIGVESQNRQQCLNIRPHKVKMKKFRCVCPGLATEYKRRVKIFELADLRQTGSPTREVLVYFVPYCIQPLPDCTVNPICLTFRLASRSPGL